MNLRKILTLLTLAFLVAAGAAGYYIFRGGPTTFKVRISQEMNVSESTLYKWREDILEIVLYAAMEAGVIGLFGIREMEEQIEPCDPEDSLLN